jgi:hypothetical protein
MMRRPWLVPVVVAMLLPGACAGTGAGSEIGEAALNVVTLQQGTTSSLRDMRGRGPFTTYDRSPAAMLEVITEAMEDTAGRRGPPYVEVYASSRYGEVVAKEFEKDKSSYGTVFRSAAIAIIHPVSGDPGRCRVEMHAIQRGPFHGGSVAWMRDLPGLIDAVLERERARDAGGVKPIP